jgi:hypothetical protein
MEVFHVLSGHVLHVLPLEAVLHYQDEIATLMTIGEQIFVNYGQRFGIKKLVF